MKENFIAESEYFLIFAFGGSVAPAIASSIGNVGRTGQHDVTKVWKLNNRNRLGWSVVLAGLPEPAGGEGGSLRN
jgi:hypothetical protein